MNHNKSIIVPSAYELLTYEGRMICDKEELGGGYCGSCPIEYHCQQMRDPYSWVHSSKHKWEKAGKIARLDKKEDEYPRCPNCGRKNGN